MKKFQDIKKFTHKFRKKTIGNIFYINYEKLSEKQKKMFYDIYLDNIRDGLESKEALEKAFQIVTCLKV